MELNLNPITNPWAFCLSVPIIALFAFVFWTGYAVVTGSARAAAHKADVEHAFETSGADRMSMRAFRDFVAGLLEARGHGVIKLDGETEAGTGLIAARDGRRTAYVVYRFDKPISPRSVREAIALRDRHGCDLASVVTTSRFRDDARKLAAELGCALIDREALAEWILAQRRGADGVRPA